MESEQVDALEMVLGLVAYSTVDRGCHVSYICSSLLLFKWLLVSRRLLGRSASDLSTKQNRENLVANLIECLDVTVWSRHQFFGLQG